MGRYRGFDLCGELTSKEGGGLGMFYNCRGNFFHGGFNIKGDWHIWILKKSSCVGARLLQKSNPGI